MHVPGTSSTSNTAAIATKMKPHWGKWRGGAAGVVGRRRVQLLRTLSFLGRVKGSLQLLQR